MNDVIDSEETNARGPVDLKTEQQKSLHRPRLRYSLSARLFFAMMDLVTGRQVTLSKTKLIEILASIPYRAWEHRQYLNLTGSYRSENKVRHFKRILQWGREAQDNEYYHLLVINAKMKEDGIRDSWYLYPPIPFLMVLFYRVFSAVMARFCIRGAFLFNAEFEDHAEHVYARFVEDNPQWDDEPVKSDVVREYGPFDNWGQVFRRIGLDEREHRNHSFVFAGKDDQVV